jgi:hypothetical protein
MRAFNLLMLSCAVVISLSLGACGGGDDDGDGGAGAEAGSGGQGGAGGVGGSAGTSGDEPQGFATAELQELFNVQCGPACHIGGPSIPNLSDVNTVIGADSSADVPQVEAGSRSNSYLYHKLLGTQGDVGGRGGLMPLGRPALDADTIERIGLWIDGL